MVSERMNTYELKVNENITALDTAYKLSVSKMTLTNYNE